MLCYYHIKVSQSSVSQFQHIFALLKKNSKHLSYVYAYKESEKGFKGRIDIRLILVSYSQTIPHMFINHKYLGNLFIELNVVSGCEYLHHIWF